MDLGMGIERGASARYNQTCPNRGGYSASVLRGEKERANENGDIHPPPHAADRRSWIRVRRHAPQRGRGPICGRHESGGISAAKALRHTELRAPERARVETTAF